MTRKVHPAFVNEAGKKFTGFAFSNLGSAGVFLAMITAVVSVKIFVTIQKKDGLSNFLMQCHQQFTIHLQH